MASECFRHAGCQWSEAYLLGTDERIGPRGAEFVESGRAGYQKPHPAVVLNGGAQQARHLLELKPGIGLFIKAKQYPFHRQASGPRLPARCAYLQVCCRPVLAVMGVAPRSPIRGRNGPSR